MPPHSRCAAPFGMRGQVWLVADIRSDALNYPLQVRKRTLPPANMTVLAPAPFSTRRSPQCRRCAGSRQTPSNSRTSTSYKKSI